jgi:hypothetical protein
VEPPILGIDRFSLTFLSQPRFIGTGSDGRGGCSHDPPINQGDGVQDLKLFLRNMPGVRVARLIPSVRI